MAGDKPNKWQRRKGNVVTVAADGLDEKKTRIILAEQKLPIRRSD
jgi:hypothetical protein